MRNDDSVFFFTLVDFLLTTLFFGLVLFSIGRKSATEEREQRAKADIVDSLRKATGISDLTVLTDRLTRLAPLKVAEEAVGLVRKAGGIEEARRALRTVAVAGGTDSVAARLNRLQQREGAGKPHCLFVETKGRKEAVPIATVIGTDSTLSFERETPELASVLASVGTDFAHVRVLGPREFRRVFARVLEARPECLYTIDFVERTRYVDARDAARGIFYMRIHR